MIATKNKGCLCQAHKLRARLESSRGMELGVLMLGCMQVSLTLWSDILVTELIHQALGTFRLFHDALLVVLTD